MVGEVVGVVLVKKKMKIDEKNIVLSNKKLTYFFFIHVQLFVH